MAGVSMDEMQFQQFLQAMQGVFQQTVAQQASVKKDRRILFEKGYNRLEKFSHGEQDWADWAYDFKTILGTQCHQMKLLLEAVEGEKMVTNADLLYRKFEVAMKKVEDVADIVKVNHELYEILNVLTAGDAKKMVKGIVPGDGISAWIQLNINFNRKTLAKTLRVHKEAMHPKQANMQNLLSAITEWEEKWRIMAKDTTGELPKIFKVAAFLEICPGEIQDVIYQNIDEAGDDYEKLSQKVKVWVSNKMAARNDPVPMDIGDVGAAHGGEGYECEPCGLDVGAVGQHIQCYRCGGWGHTSRECPTPKGSGKGGGDRKGMKGHGKSDGWAGKGAPRMSTLTTTKGGGKGHKGKGYQGECWKCGKMGHKQWECRGGKSIGAIGEECDEEFEVEVEVPQGAVTVWHVNSVEVKNQFQALEEEPTVKNEIEINVVQTEKAEKTEKKKCTVTVDSGAGASCLPKSWVPDVPLKPKKKGVKFVAAQGSDMNYYGRKDVRFRALRSENGQVKKGSMAEMEFHVTNANKALASAADVVEAGNTIIMSKKKGESYIINDMTKEKIYLRKENGTFVFDAELQDEFEGEGADMEVDEEASKTEKKRKPTFGRQA